MGWTHRAAESTLFRYPALGTIPELLERWPALKLAVSKQEEKLGASFAELIEKKAITTPGPEGNTADSRG